MHSCRVRSVVTVLIQCSFRNQAKQVSTALASSIKAQHKPSGLINLFDNEMYFRLTDAPVINLRIDSLTFFEGDAALVQNLVISAYPPVTRFEWMHEGRRIPLAKEPEKYRGGPRHRITYRNDVLNFTEIHRNDSGVYILKAQNAVGWGETNFTIDVHCE